jgi:SAM-dependent methyltransferase
MTTIQAAGPNAEQIRYWNEEGSPKWLAYETLLDAQLEPFALAVMERATPDAGERVLDVGCGTGRTSLLLAERVGARGWVTGIDIATPMLERARTRARQAGARNLRFENADATLHDFGDERFDLLFSRFGVMFFADPAASFANLHRALAPGARLAFVCWQGLQRNPWMLVPLLAAAKHVALPGPPPPDAPGPFSFQDPDRVRRVLGAAGFREIALEPLEGPLGVGGGQGLDGAVDFLMHVGPLGRVLREAGDAAAGPAVVEAIRQALRPFETEQGIQLESAAWIVSARAG